MVAGIVKLAGGGDIAAASATGNDAARASIVAAWRWDGVFAIVAVGLLRQAFFKIAEGAAVLVWIRKGAAAPDQKKCFSNLGRQLGQLYSSNAAVGVGDARLSARVESENHDQRQ